MNMHLSWPAYQRKCGMPKGKLALLKTYKNSEVLRDHASFSRFDTLTSEQSQIVNIPAAHHKILVIIKGGTGKSFVVTATSGW